MSKIYVDEIAGIASPSTVAIPGHVIQVVQGTYSTPVTITGTTAHTHTGLTASITPSSTSSKILVMVDSPGRMYREAGAGLTINCRLYRDGSSVGGDRNYNGYDNGDAWYDAFQVGFQYLDSPATTSSVEYKLYASMAATSLSAELVFQQSNGSPMSTITLMEIAG